MGTIGCCGARTCERDQEFLGKITARYNYVLQFVKDKKVLDVGCGLGFGSNYMASNGAREVLGIDISEAAIESARKSFRLPNLSYKVMNATEISARNRDFDVVTAFEVIEHLPLGTHDNFLKGICENALKEGGVAIISTPNKKLSPEYLSKRHHPYHPKEFEPFEFKELLSRYFAKVSLQGYRCVNEEYVTNEEQIRKTFRHRFICWVGQSKLIRDFFGFIPLGFRRKISGEDRLPPTGAADFQICEDVDNCTDMIAVCRN